MDNYDTDELPNEKLQSQVVVIHICAYINEKNEGDREGIPPTNHWATFLQLVGGGSVRLDMIPGYGSDGLRGKIELAYKGKVVPRNSKKTLSFGPKAHATVQTIIDAINSKGRDKYKFTEEWGGCRFWIYTVISDLEAAGLIDAGSGQST